MIGNWLGPRSRGSETGGHTGPRRRARIFVGGAAVTLLLAISAAPGTNTDAQAASVAANCNTSRTKVVASSTSLSISSPTVVPIADAEATFRLKKELQCVIVQFSAEGFAPFPSQTIDVLAELSNGTIADPPLVSLVSYGPTRGTSNAANFVFAFVPAGKYTVRMMFRTTDSGGQAAFIGNYTMIVHY
jgi:hypothetical protein